MCLVASSWWSYWSHYAALTKEDLERIPERMALGLCTTRGWEHSPGNGNAAGGKGETPWVVPVDAAAGVQGVGVGRGFANGVGVGEVGNGNGVGPSLGRGGAIQSVEDLAVNGRERVVPTMLARRPHEIDNSTLQVRPSH